MENKEKKADLEQLLNTLIEKGWEPFGIKNKILHVSRTPDNMIYFDGGFALERCYDFRQLTSKESGLWQFVCENGMIATKDLETESGESDRWTCRYNCDGYPEDDYYSLWREDYKFWLIESALEDESELEEFLLSNIKVDD